MPPKRRKTFTGCWRCRERKVKCDGTRPHCQRCRYSQLQCTGYGIELRWAPPQQLAPSGALLTPSGDFASTEDDLAKGAPKSGPSRRRNVDFVVYPKEMVYTTYNELEQDVNLLNTPSPVADEVRFAGPFGVFAANPKPVEMTLFPESFEPVFGSYGLSQNLGANLKTMAFHPKTKLDTISEIEEMYRLQDARTTFLPIELYRPRDDVAQHVPPGIGDVISVAVVVLPATRYLLTHFMRDIAPMMTVVSLPQNPCVSQYIPRALRALGDLCSIGESDYTNHCTFNALLAISAFHLRKQFPQGLASWQYWHRVAASLRRTAARFMVRCIHNQLSSHKYKDVIISLLTMAQIDVASGSMRLCRACLDLCGSHMASRKRTLSKKAVVLHRIYLFQKLIEELTQVFDSPEASSYTAFVSVMDSEPEEPDTTTLIPRESVPALPLHYYNTNCLFDESADDAAEDHQRRYEGRFEEQVTDRGRVSIHHIVDGALSPSIAPQLPQFIEMADHVLDDHETVEVKTLPKFSTDELFGLPNLLILLFQEMVRLFRLKMRVIIEMTRDSATRSLSQLRSNLMAFRKDVRSFERNLLQWSLEWGLWKEDGRTFISHTHRSVYHHVLLFKDAMCVYFYRIVKHMPYEHIRHHAEACVRHLTEIESDFRIVAPLFWVPFVVGCETPDPQLQRQLLSLCDGLAERGVSDYHVARAVMQKVWEKGDDYTWIHVLRDYDVSLLLI